PQPARFARPRFARILGDKEISRGGADFLSARCSSDASPAPGSARWSELGAGEEGLEIAARDSLGSFAEALGRDRGAAASELSHDVVELYAAGRLVVQGDVQLAEHGHRSRALDGSRALQPQALGGAALALEALE